MSDVATQNIGRVCVVHKGNYSSTITYEKLDIVYHNGYSYLAKQSSKGQTPVANASTDYWALLAGSGAGQPTIVNNVLRWN